MDQNNSAPASSDLNLSPVQQRLATIDHAYVNSTREACVRLVDDLYAYFDEMTGGAVSCFAVLGLSMFGMLASLD